MRSQNAYDVQNFTFDVELVVILFDGGWRWLRNARLQVQ
jgi:hypothetical protein